MNFRIRSTQFCLKPATYLLPLPLLFACCTPLYAAPGIDDALITPEAVSLLEQRAQTAQPKDQCFMYTELVHSMTELAGKQMLAGDTSKASATLKRVEHYARLIQVNLVRDAKRLKNAELIMHHTTRRLGEYMHAASSDDRVVLQATLKQLDQVQTDILTQVFAK